MKKIVLTTPILKPYYADTVVLSHVGWHPDQQTVTIRLSIGYFDDLGKWIEAGDKHYIFKNTETSRDYDNIIKIVQGSDLSTKNIENVLIENFLKDFPGELI